MSNSLSFNLQFNLGCYCYAVLHKKTPLSSSYVTSLCIFFLHVLGLQTIQVVHIQDVVLKSKNPVCCRVCIYIRHTPRWPSPAPRWNKQRTKAAQSKNINAFLFRFTFLVVVQPSKCLFLLHKKTDMPSVLTYLNEQAFNSQKCDHKSIVDA